MHSLIFIKFRSVALRLPFDTVRPTTETQYFTQQEVSLYLQ